MAGADRRTLDTGEPGVLADEIAGVGAAPERLDRRRGERGAAGPLAADPGEDALELPEKAARRGRDARRAGVVERRAGVASRGIDADALGARLAARHLPGVLEGEVGDDLTGRDPPRAGLAPRPAMKLEGELRVGAVAQLLDRGALQVVEAGRTVVQRAQDGERDGEQDVIGV